jgi:hypothetical protein
MGYAAIRPSQPGGLAGVDVPGSRGLAVDTGPARVNMMAPTTEWLQCRNPECPEALILVPSKERDPRCSCGQILKRPYVKPTVTRYACPDSDSSSLPSVRQEHAADSSPETVLGPSIKGREHRGA